MSPTVREFCLNSQYIGYATAGVAVVSLLAIIFCFRRRAPVNLILLLIFTACITYTVGGFTAQYDSDIVILAGLATALTVISLTIYTMVTKESISFCYAMAFVVFMGIVPLFLIGIFALQSKTLYVVYCALGLLLFSIFLILDTMRIVAGKMIGIEALDMDEYIMGSLMLYIDIIIIFIFLLKLLSKLREE